MLDIANPHGNANLNHNEISPHLLKWLLSKDKKYISKYVEKRKPLYTFGENVNWQSHYGKQYGVSFLKLKIELPYNPGIPLLGIYPKKMKTLIQKDICTLTFVVALFSIAKIGKQPMLSLSRSCSYTHTHKHTHTHTHTHTHQTTCLPMQEM